MFSRHGPWRIVDLVDGADQPAQRNSASRGGGSLTVLSLKSSLVPKNSCVPSCVDCLFKGLWKDVKAHEMATGLFVSDGRRSCSEQTQATGKPMTRRVVPPLPPKGI